MFRLGSRLLLLLASGIVTTLLISCGVTPNPVAPTDSAPSNPDKTTPSISWAQPAPITSPTPLGAQQLNATATVPGNFVYSPAAGTVLSPGNQRLTTTFTPTDTTDYNTASSSVTLVVNPGAAASTCASGAATTAAAYVYLTTGSQSDSQIAGFSAAADGTLTAVPGSHFPTTGASPLITAGTGSILFGTDGYNIDSYRVNPGGCLTLESSIFAGDPTDSGIVIAGLILDRSGANLYSYSSNEASDGTNPEFTSWNFNPQTGQLTQIGAQAGFAGDVLAFSSGDQYAVSPRCTAWVGPFLTEYQRGSEGSLTVLGQVAWPAAAPGYGSCPMVAAADNEGHFVVGMGAEQGGAPSNDSSNPDLFATYSIDASGKMTTASTVQNMPTSTLGWLGSLQFSPDNRYLSASGYAGLEVFAWDSASMSMTSIATIPSGASCTNSSCTGPGFGNLDWDQNDHLYTILGQQLLVYDVSPSGVTPAPGSPYTLNNPAWVTVLPQNSPNP